MNERALAIFEREFGELHANTAIVHNNLGLTLKELGDFEGSLAHLERASRVWSEVLGPNHPQVGISLNNAAATLWKQGELRKALPLMRRALGLLVGAYGAAHPLCASIDWAVGAVQRGDPCPI